MFVIHSFSGVTWYDIFIDVLTDMGLRLTLGCIYTTKGPVYIWLAKCLEYIGFDDRH